jgi:hypothetical protein
MNKIKIVEHQNGTTDLYLNDEKLKGVRAAQMTYTPGQRKVTITLDVNKIEIAKEKANDL